MGYRNTESSPLNPPVWQQVVTSTSTTCMIMIQDYTAFLVFDQGETFTITVP